MRRLSDVSLVSHLSVPLCECMQCACVYASLLQDLRACVCMHAAVTMTRSTMGLDGAAQGVRGDAAQRLRRDEEDADAAGRLPRRPKDVKVSPSSP